MNIIPKANLQNYRTLYKKLTKNYNTLISLDNEAKDLKKNILNHNVSNRSSSIDKYNELVKEYNSLIPTYNELFNKFNEKKDRYDNFITLKEVIQDETIIPNAKDENEWLPGGDFYNSTFAGGIFFNPLSPLDVKLNNRPNFDLATAIMIGNIYSFLNKGYTDLKNTINSFGLIDLLNDYKISKTIIYNIKIEVDKKEIIKQDIIINLNNENDNKDFKDVQVITQNKGVMDLSQINDMYHFKEKQTLARDLLNTFTSNPINSVITLSIIDIATGKEVQAQNRIGNFTTNEVINTLSKVATSKLVDVLGITSGLLGFSIFAGIKSLVTELFEVGTKLDNHFGFGGELIGFDQNNMPVYSAPKSFTQFIRDLMPNSIKSAIGMDITTNDILSSFETKGFDNVFGLTNQFKDTKSYSYDYLSGETIGITQSRDIMKSSDFKDIEKQSRSDAKSMMDQLDHFNDHSHGDHDHDSFDDFNDHGGDTDGLDGVGDFPSSDSDTGIG